MSIILLILWCVMLDPTALIKILLSVNGYQIVIVGDEEDENEGCLIEL